MVTIVDNTLNGDRQESGSTTEQGYTNTNNSRTSQYTSVVHAKQMVQCVSVCVCVYS